MTVKQLLYIFYALARVPWLVVYDQAPRSHTLPTALPFQQNLTIDSVASSQASQKTSEMTGLTADLPRSLSEHCSSSSAVVVTCPRSIVTDASTSTLNYGQGVIYTSLAYTVQYKIDSFNTRYVQSFLSDCIMYKPQVSILFDITQYLTQHRRCTPALTRHFTSPRTSHSTPLWICWLLLEESSPRCICIHIRNHFLRYITRTHDFLVIRRSKSLFASHTRVYIISCVSRKLTSRIHTSYCTPSWTVTAKPCSVSQVGGGQKGIFSGKELETESSELSVCLDPMATFKFADHVVRKDADTICAKNIELFASDIPLRCIVPKLAIKDLKRVADIHQIAIKRRCK